MSDAREFRYRLKLWLNARRASLRTKLSTWVTRYRGTPLPVGSPLTPAPETVLICRVNKRLGNTLFVTPLLKALWATLPGVKIDVLVRNAGYQGLLNGLPGVSKVICVPDNVLERLRFIKDLRRKRYDLAVDPTINSTSNRMVMSLCKANSKLGFASEDQWVNLTHAVPVPDDEPHQARQALMLLKTGILGAPDALVDNLQVFVSEESISYASERLNEALENRTKRPLLGFFPLATGSKQLSAAWWDEWMVEVRQRLPEATLIRVLPPGHQPPLPSDTISLTFSKLDQLAGLISLLDLFVAADSGPMHLAAATGVPTIGLFRATDPARYAPLGVDCLTLEGEDLKPAVVVRRLCTHLEQLRRKRSEHL